MTAVDERIVGDATQGRPAVAYVDLRALHDSIRTDLDLAWREALDSSSFVGGHLVERFEAQWAEYCSSATAIGVGNGTDALELIFSGLGIGKGDEVIVPANTFVATAEAVAAVGARPRFVDIDPKTQLLTAEIVADGITSSTAAVVVVHLHGSMPDMRGIAEICERAGIALVEDAAQAHGATHCGRRAGSWGVAAGFSFYPGKNLGALGDAGAITTSDEILAASIRRLANHGRSSTQPGHHDVAGRNSRLDGVQAAVLSAKLVYLDQWNDRRREVAQRYDAALDPHIVRYSIPVETNSVHHLYVIETESREDVRSQLTDRGVATGLHYPVPCHLLQPFAGMTAQHLPVAEARAGRILSLPMHPMLSEPQVDFVCEQFNEITARLGTSGEEARP